MLRNNYIFEGEELVEVQQCTDPFLETHISYVVMPFLDVEGEDITCKELSTLPSNA